MYGRTGDFISASAHKRRLCAAVGKKTKKIIVNFVPVIKGHFGGDEGIIKATIGMLSGNSDPNMQYTWIKDTIESHRIVAAAEISRHEGGRAVMMSEIPDIRE